MAHETSNAEKAGALPASKRRPTPPPRAFLVLLAVLAVLAAAGFAAFSLMPRPVVIGFYGLDDSISGAIRERASALVPKGRGAEFLALDSGIPLTAQQKTVKKTAILFLADGAAAAQLAGSSVPPAQSLLNLIPSGIRGAGLNETQRYGLPILLDHFELAWNIRLLARKGFPRPDSIESLEAAARGVKSATVWPLVCAGAEDRDLSEFIGAVVEAACGPAALSRLTGRMAAGDSPQAIGDDTELAPAFEAIRRWRRDGLLHPEWLSIDGATLERLMESDATAFAFMPLSRHRLIAQNTIEKYDSTFVPALGNRRERTLIAPAVVALRMLRSRPDADADAFFASLLAPETQKALSFASGLAPTSSVAETQDRQAADVRLWAASSRGPRPDPAVSAFDDPLKRKEFLADLREWLRRL